MEKPVRDLLVKEVANVISAETAYGETQSVSGRFGLVRGTPRMKAFVGIKRNPVKDGFALHFSPKESGKSILRDFNKFPV